MKSILSTVAACAAILVSPLAQAQAVTVYDRFDIGMLDATRWAETETVRYVSHGRLVYGLSTPGHMDKDIGAAGGQQDMRLLNPELITTVNTSVYLDTVAALACDTNKVVGSTKLRIGGGFFNVGTPEPKSAIGDVQAFITLSRSSNSSDPEGTVKVTGTVQRCRSMTCGLYTTIGTADLGQLSVGNRTRLYLKHDRATKSFVFQRDPQSEPVRVAYEDNDSLPATRIDKTIGIRNLAPNCASGERTMSRLITFIDNVAINTDAMPE